MPGPMSSPNGQVSTDKQRTGMVRTGKTALKHGTLAMSEKKRAEKNRKHRESLAAQRAQEED